MPRKDFEFFEIRGVIHIHNRLPGVIIIGESELPGDEYTGDRPELVHKHTWWCKIHQGVETLL
jgi:hypothetical protein